MYHSILIMPLLKKINRIYDNPLFTKQQVLVSGNQGVGKSSLIKAFAINFNRFYYKEHKKECDAIYRSLQLNGYPDLKIPDNYIFTNDSFKLSLKKDIRCSIANPNDIAVGNPRFAVGGLYVLDDRADVDYNNRNNSKSNTSAVEAMKYIRHMKSSVVNAMQMGDVLNKEIRRLYTHQILVTDKKTYNFIFFKFTIWNMEIFEKRQVANANGIDFYWGSIGKRKYIFFGDIHKYYDDEIMRGYCLGQCAKNNIKPQNLYIETRESNIELINTIKGYPIKKLNDDADENSEEDVSSKPEATQRVANSDDDEKPF